MADDGLQLERTNRFWPFLISLSLLFVAGPLAHRLDLGNWYRLAFMAVLVTGAYLVGNTRRHLIIALALGAPAFLLQGVAIAVQDTTLGVVATVATLACLGYVTALSFVRVLEPGDVSSDRLIGSACVYLLLGVIWSMVYSMQALFDPAPLSSPRTAPTSAPG